VSKLLPFDARAILIRASQTTDRLGPAAKASAIEAAIATVRSMYPSYFLKDHHAN
jgi:hypothetical protein